MQHFIDRKVATLFEPLLNMSRDETLTGMARGFAFQMVEALGILPIESVAEDVKALDQEARGQLRKHGIRFGQYTIFQQLLLKPAPTRLRLVLWSLANGLQEFPESPPPGLVTIPNIPDVPMQHYTLAGYRPAGSRAIRIDMLERLADLLRGQDSRGGFEAIPDMLSITGMTLDQFADLMTGLGYKGEKAERPKAKPPAPKELTAEAIAEAAALAAAASKIIVPDDVPAQAPAPGAEPTPDSPAQAAPESTAESTAAAPAAEAAVEMESFITFTWAPRPRADRRPQRPDARPEGAAAQPRDGEKRERGRRDGAKRDGTKHDGAKRSERGAGQGATPPRTEAAAGGRNDAGRPEGGRGPRPEGGFKGRGKKGGKPPQNAPQKYESRPARTEKKIDPDNPFAALAALKGKI